LKVAEADKTSNEATDKKLCYFGHNNETISIFRESCYGRKYNGVNDLRK